MNKNSFLDSLEEVETLVLSKKETSLRSIMKILAGKGHATILIILSIPFCLPIQIPGFSTPFGIAIAFIGLRIAFGKRPWLPKWLLEKKFSQTNLLQLLKKTKKAVSKVQKAIKPRLSFLATTPSLHRLNGILVCLLALLLALPLPLPLTNLFSAFPILFMGFGLLEEDGVCILISYALSLLCFAFFTGLFFFGEELIKRS